ncbi:MAG TPA: alpha/beta fold hydrolase [Planctomycetota bacterium]|nr:alpha/beta fold hydrolase [Planctomycetota bacterium]
MQAFLSTRLAAWLPLPAAWAPALLLAALAPVFSAPKTADPAPSRVALEAPDKQALVATYYPPTESMDKASAVLLVHDAGRSREELLPLALRLQKSGFAVLALDLRGHGESATAELDWKQLDEEGQGKAWNSMAGDIKAGVEFLGTQKGVLPASVSLLSSGASSLLIARHAVRDERVRELVLIDPKTEGFGRSLVKDLQLLDGIPTLIVVGKGDTANGKRVVEAVAKTGTDARSIVVKCSKLESAQILADKAAYADISRWMTDSLATKPGPKN